MLTLILPCPAKLNLFLHITGRRPDGYHNLQTVFQLLSYGDTLELTPRDDGIISLTPELPGVPLEANLIYRAARLLQEASGCSLGADFLLHKRLPMGGGIGGGSSDAASALVGLNHVWRTGLSLEQLADLGQRLGADIPVFVCGQSAWAEGTGEQLTPISLPEVWYLVITPQCEVPTGRIFSHNKLTRNSSAITMRAFLEEGGRNDCQPLVEDLFPEVKYAVDWLNSFGSTSLYPAKLTGTGASVFTAFAAEDEACAVLAMRPHKLKGFVAKGVNESPLHSYLRKSQ